MAVESHRASIDPTLAALSAAPSNPLLDLPSGARIAVALWGSGTPVLCLHAVGHASGDFADLARRLGDGFELIAPDWPGMGYSPADGRSVRADHFAVVAREVADALGLVHPFVIGSSIGGAAAIIMAAREPERFAGLVLCNAGGLAAIDGPTRFILGRMRAFFRAGVRGAPWFRIAFNAYYRFAVLTANAARGRRTLVVRAGEALAPLLADAWDGFAEPSADIRPLAPKLDLPVWLAWTKGDRFVAWDRAKAAAATMPRSRTTLFRGGHCAFLEDPETFADGFRRFVAEVETGFSSEPSAPMTEDAHA